MVNQVPDWDRDKRVAQMSGWFHVQMDALHGVQSERFNKVLHS